MIPRRFYLHLLPIVAWCCYASTAFAGPSFEVKDSLGQVARKAQAKLPQMATDGLLEAQRKSAKWFYAFNIRVEKIYCDQVRVTLEQVNALQTKVTVDVVRVQGGLLSTSIRPLPESLPQWTGRIQQALK